MGKVINRIKYDGIKTGEGQYNDIHTKYMYEFKYTDGTTYKLEEI